MVLAIRHCKKKVRKETKAVLESLEAKFMLQLPANGVPGGDAEQFIKRRASKFHGAKKHFRTLEEYWTSVRGWWSRFYKDTLNLTDDELDHSFMAAPKKDWNVFHEDDWEQVLES